MRIESVCDLRWRHRDHLKRLHQIQGWRGFEAGLVGRELHQILADPHLRILGIFC